MLAQKGPDGLSIKEAASLANVSRGVAYQHFEHRDHLLREAKEWITERLLESISSTDAAADPLLHSARLILQNRDAAMLLISDGMAGRDLLPDHPIHRIVRQMLDMQKRAGQIRGDIDIEMLSYIFLGLTSTLVMLSRLPDSDVEGLAQRFSREFINFLEKGIFTGAAARA